MSSCCIIGLGYIGLPTASLLASSGYKVIGVDIKSEVVESVNNGRIHLYEPDLEQLVNDVVVSGLLSASSTVSPADIFIVTVPTPFSRTPGCIPQPMIEHVLNAATAIAGVIRPGNLVLLESTSPVGTTQKIFNLLVEYSGLDKNQIKIAYCPERVLPGSILSELRSNDRVIGGLTPVASEEAKTFYSTFCTGQLHVTDARTAELVKLTENASRDVSIAFANEMSLICEHLDVNVRELIRLANHHPRVNILQPGCGVGGHCIAVDPWFIAAAAPKFSPLIQAARAVNDGKSRWVIDQVQARASALRDQLGRSVRIGCLGLAFKPDVDDLRESPALAITTELLFMGLDVLVCEPNLSDHPTIRLHSLQYVLSHADFFVFLVAHTPFKNLPLSGRSVFDACGVTEKIDS